MYRWSDDGITAVQAIEMLREIGIVGQVALESVEALERKLQNPFQNMDGFHGVLGPLLGPRMAVASFARHDDPEHGKLFQDLANAAVPPVVLDSVKQYSGDELLLEYPNEMIIGNMPVSDTAVASQLETDNDSAEDVTFRYQGDDWVVRYEYQGVAHSFLADGAYPEGNGRLVIENFNNFMNRLGRTEQAFRLAESPDDGGEWGSFFVADRHIVADVSKRLHIPLHT